MHTDDTAHLPAQTFAEAVAEAVAVDGFDAHRTAVAGLVVDARLVGVMEILGDIVLDERQPKVARERALGRVVAAYVAALEQATEPLAESIGDRFTVAA